MTDEDVNSFLRSGFGVWHGAWGDLARDDAERVEITVTRADCGRRLAPGRLVTHPVTMGTDARLNRAGAALMAALGFRRAIAVGPLERLPRMCADLRRLDAELARLQVADRRTPALKQRLDAASWAYDRVLRDACVTAGVPAAACTPFAPVDRLLAEAALAQAGLRW